MKNVEIGLGLGGWVEPIIISGMVPLPTLCVVCFACLSEKV